MLHEFNGPEYRNLISIACETCQYFSFSTFNYYHKKDLEPSYHELLQFLSEYEQDFYKFTLPKHYSRAQIHIYKLQQETKQIFSFVDNLYNWCPSRYPEDLCFYRGKKILFESITHEKLAFLHTENIGDANQWNSFELI